MSAAFVCVGVLYMTFFELDMHKLHPYTFWCILPGNIATNLPECKLFYLNDMDRFIKGFTWRGGMRISNEGKNP